MMLELFPEGFEEDERAGGSSCSLYGRRGEERLWAAFGGARATDVEEGWEDRWRAFHRPVRIGALWVGPPWEEPDAGATAIVIDPGRAFGTGRTRRRGSASSCSHELRAAACSTSAAARACSSIAAAKLGFARCSRSTSTRRRSRRPAQRRRERCRDRGSARRRPRRPAAVRGDRGRERLARARHAIAPGSTRPRLITLRLPRLGGA